MEGAVLRPSRLAPSGAAGEQLGKGMVTAAPVGTAAARLGGGTGCSARRLVQRERGDEHPVVDRRRRLAGEHPFGAHEEGQIHRRRF
ncbi:MAG: hypothetical protein QOC65_692 [Sphingomonadales bacterium]|nr:hypothetical protein [Sphingomonadales bacterium]